MWMRRSCILIWNFLLISQLMFIAINAQFAQIGHESIPLHLFKPLNSGNNANYVAQKPIDTRVPRNQNTYVHENSFNEQSKSGAKEIKSHNEVIEHEPVVNLERSTSNQVVSKNHVSTNELPDINKIVASNSQSSNFNEYNDETDDNESDHFSFARDFLNDPNSFLKSFNIELPTDSNVVTHTGTDDNGNKVSTIVKTFKKTTREKQIINENENYQQEPQEEKFFLSDEPDNSEIFSNKRNKNNNGRLRNNFERLFNLSIFDEIPSLSID